MIGFWLYLNRFMEYFVDDYWDELYNEDNIGKGGGEKVGKYSDDEIRSCKKITLKIAADYHGISPLAVGLGMRK